MGRQIIQQPDGRFAAFSSVSDGFLFTDATSEEVETYFVEVESRKTRREIREVLDAVEAGKANSIYFQFAMTWKEAVSKHNETFPTNKIDPHRPPKKVKERPAFIRPPKKRPEDWIDRVCRDVAELGDRTSPEDKPDQMLVTAEELRSIIETHIETKG